MIPEKINHAGQPDSGVNVSTSSDGCTDLQAEYNNVMTEDFDCILDKNKKLVKPLRWTLAKSISWSHSFTVTSAICAVIFSCMIPLLDGAVKQKHRLLLSGRKHKGNKFVWLIKKFGNAQNNSKVTHAVFQFKNNVPGSTKDVRRSRNDERRAVSLSRRATDCDVSVGGGCDVSRARVSRRPPADVW